MTRVTFQISASIHKRAKLLAKREGLSLDQLITSALAEKISDLEAADYLKSRSAHGSRAHFNRLLAKVPSRKPLKGDVVPTFK